MSATQPNNVYTDSDGNVYRRLDNGSWQQRQQGEWRDADSGPRAEAATQVQRAQQNRAAGTLNRDFTARQRGNLRTANFNQAGGRAFAGRRR